MSTILVVDDERNIREVVAAVLQDEGYDVRTAINGRRAIELLREGRPALILLDVQMPELDGREVLRWARAQPALADTPVVMMSSALWADVGDPQATAFLPKPFDLDHLLSTVGRLLGK